MGIPIIATLLGVAIIAVVAIISKWPPPPSPYALPPHQGHLLVLGTMLCVQVPPGAAGAVPVHRVGVSGVTQGPFREGVEREPGALGPAGAELRPREAGAAAPARRTYRGARKYRFPEESGTLARPRPRPPRRWQATGSEGCRPQRTPPNSGPALDLSWPCAHRASPAAPQGAVTIALTDGETEPREGDVAGWKSHRR